LVLFSYQVLSVRVHLLYYLINAVGAYDCTITDAFALRVLDGLHVRISRMHHR